MLLTVETVGPSKSGKALRVKAGGKWYGAKKDSGITAGTTIDAETSTGDYGDWIDKWKPSNGSAAPQASGVSNAPSGSPNSSRDHPAGAAPAWLPFASNTVAHAINAGIIKEPSDVKAWAAAAKQAYTELA